MAARPLRNLSIEDLTTKARAAQSTSALEEIKYELQHRTTKAAGSLLREVGTSLAEGVAAKTTDVRRGPKRTKEAGSRSESGPAHGNSGPSGIADTDPGPAGAADLACRYKSLRETFTLEAETLARWGLTSLAPLTLREIVVNYWRDELHRNDASHPLGLGPVDLERDLRNLGSRAVGAIEE